MTRRTIRYSFQSEESFAKFAAMDAEEKICWLSWKVESAKLSSFEDKIRRGDFILQGFDLWA